VAETSRFGKQDAEAGPAVAKKYGGTSEGQHCATGGRWQGRLISMGRLPLWEHEIVNEDRKQYHETVQITIVVVLSMLAYLGVSFVLAALLDNAVRWHRIEPPYIRIVGGVALVDAAWTVAVWAAWPIRSLRVRMYLSIFVYMVSAAIPTGLFIQWFFHDLA
jgi:hypothetical protein